MRVSSFEIFNHCSTISTIFHFFDESNRRCPKSTDAIREEIPSLVILFNPSLLSPLPLDGGEAKSHGLHFSFKDGLNDGNESRPSLPIDVARMGFVGAVGEGVGVFPYPVHDDGIRPLCYIYLFLAFHEGLDIIDTKRGKVWHEPPL